MYAVIETGGKQYRVELGAELELDQLTAAPGDTIDLGRVLLVADGDTALIGQPVVDGARVTAEIVRPTRGQKIIVFKYRPKARHRAKQGHRQDLTVVRIADIEFDGRSAAREAEARAEQEEKTRAAAAKAAAAKAAADQALADKLARDQAERAKADKADKAKADKADKAKADKAGKADKAKTARSAAKAAPAKAKTVSAAKAKPAKPTSSAKGKQDEDSAGPARSSNKDKKDE